jgi:uncharacterized iron-regulated protein
MVRAALLVALLLAGCVHRARGPELGTSRPRSASQPTDVDIERAALPYHVLAARGGAQVERQDFLAALVQADAVCLGEEHPDPHHHWLQLELVRTLIEAARRDGRELALGLEMIQRPFQGVVDDHVRGTIDEDALLARTGWATRWGYDFALYAPIVRAVIAAGHPVLALNAPGELTRRVARGGLASLSSEERAALPQLVLDDAAHRAWFAAATEGHEGGHAEDFYTAQVIWDETMADTASRWLTGQPGQRRQVVILAGTGHCMAAAVPARLRRRGAARVISVRPVVDDGGGAVADALASPEGDYLVVLDARGQAVPASHGGGKPPGHP